MNPLEELLESYLDLARHLDPLRYQLEAPAEVRGRLGRFDAAWLQGQVVALRSIANAVEDLETVDARDDEIDRTMLLDTLRGDILRLQDAAAAPTSDPGVPLRHATVAIDQLLGADHEGALVALRARVDALPLLLAEAREERRPAPDFLVAAARIDLEFLHDALDLASERLDDAAIQPTLVAVAEHRAWLGELARVGGAVGLGEKETESRLALLASEPVGIKGTLRLLELRRAGIERYLEGLADELGFDDWRAAVTAVLGDESVNGEEWLAERERVSHWFAMVEMPGTLADDDDTDSAQRSIAALTTGFARQAAAAVLDAARSGHPRTVRRRLLAPGLLAGWGRTLCALARDSALFDTTERRVVLAHRALVDAVAAESDLLLHAGRMTPADLVARAQAHAAIGEEEASGLVYGAAESPLAALAAALAHEGWIAWHAEEGGEPIAFLRRALQGGGLSVPLARWSLGSA